MSDAKAEYTFQEEQPELVGEVRLTWQRNGVADPLNFWVVPVALVEDAKARVSAGEFDEIGEKA